MQAVPFCNGIPFHKFDVGYDIAKRFFPVLQALKNQSAGLASQFDSIRPDRCQLWRETVCKIQIVCPDDTEVRRNGKMQGGADVIQFSCFNVVDAVNSGKIGILFQETPYCLRRTFRKNCGFRQKNSLPFQFRHKSSAAE